MEDQQASAPKIRKMLFSKCVRFTFMVGILFWSQLQVMLLLTAPKIAVRSTIPQGIEDALAAEASTLQEGAALGQKRLRESIDDHANIESIDAAKADLDVFDYTPQFPIFSLELCSINHGRYHCLNSPTCALPNCASAKKPGQVTKFRSNYAAFIEQAAKRRATWRSILSRRGLMGRKSILVLITNAGFVHLLANWVCSLMDSMSRDEFEAIKARTIILASDDAARSFVERDLGFFAPTREEFQSISSWTNRAIMSSPAIAFGRGSHGSLNMILKFASTLDLTSMGFQVMVQDVDVVWFKNAFASATQLCPQETCDFAFIHESRSWKGGDFAPSEFSPSNWLRQGEDELMEMNTGMFIVNPTPLAVEALKTIIQGHHLQTWHGRDQPLFNSVLYHEKFAGLRLAFFPNEEFLPGNALHVKKVESDQDNPLKTPGVVAAHVSDTATYLKKIQKMKLLDAWFLGRSECKPILKACESIPKCADPMNATYFDDRTNREYLDETDPEWIRLFRKTNLG